jgi:hypothetical protein
MSSVRCIIQLIEICSATTRLGSARVVEETDAVRELPAIRRPIIALNPEPIGKVEPPR